MTTNPIKHISDLFDHHIKTAILDQEDRYFINWLKGFKDEIFEIIHKSKLNDLLECDRIEKLILDKGYSFLYGINYTNVIYTIVINPSNKALTNNVFKAKSKLECLKLVELHLKEEINE